VDIVLTLFQRALQLRSEHISVGEIGDSCLSCVLCLVLFVGG